MDVNVDSSVDMREGSVGDAPPARPDRRRRNRGPERAGALSRSPSAAVSGGAALRSQIQGRARRKKLVSARATEDEILQARRGFERFMRTAKTLRALLEIKLEGVEELRG